MSVMNPAMADRLAGMKFWSINYSPSLDDGRPRYGSLLIAVDHFAYASCQTARFRKALILLCGDPMPLVMGVSPEEGWNIAKRDLDYWNNRAEVFAASNPSALYVGALFLSTGPTIKGWPDPAATDDMRSTERLAGKVHWFKHFRKDRGEPDWATPFPNAGGWD